MDKHIYLYIYKNIYIYIKINIYIYIYTYYIYIYIYVTYIDHYIYIIGYMLVVLLPSLSPSNALWQITVNPKTIRSEIHPDGNLLDASRAAGYCGRPLG